MRLQMRSTIWLLSSAITALASSATLIQPKVNPGPSEPDWKDILHGRWGLDLRRDLRNPLYEGTVPACSFARVSNGPVTFTPLIALGKETTTHGGWYKAVGEELHVGELPAFTELWAYTYKQPESEITSGTFTPPPLDSGSISFNPGDKPFGLWVSNDAFAGERVCTNPRLVAATNARLKPQPYKATIYPNVDAKTHEPIANSFIIGWEYSDNDDFQDVVARIDNVRLLPASKLPGIVDGGPTAKQVAGGFDFTEGPAWSVKENALFFSNIPASQIVRYQDGKTVVANADSGQSNGLMFDKAGALIACEHKNRRVSRAEVPGQPAKTVIDQYQGKRLNSPNDLWIDSNGGIYFTDPRYGGRDDLEQDKEAVYYVTGDGRKIARIIDDLVRPNGIALSPDGKWLYVIDNGASLLYRYPVNGPGQLGKGERIAYTPGPDGMTVDCEGRLYVAGLSGVYVLAANGTWIGEITAAEQPANCTFGGKDHKTLFITARKGLYALDTSTHGWHVHLDGVPASQPGK